MATVNTVPDSGNPLIDSLVWGTKWDTGEIPAVITVGIVTQGGVAPTAAEIAAIKATLAEFERVINVKFEFIGVDNANQADLHFFIYNDRFDSTLGWAVPPGEQGEAGFGDINILRSSYVVAGGALGRGGYDYITYIHEFAHAMGLAHPHDNGGGSLIFPGVTSPFNSYGLFNLNQGIFTTMSYNDGWPKGGLAQTNPAYGFQSGLMALDIQALQYIYGANTTYASGNDTYSLPTVNGAGTGYVCIWDTGGIDTIALTGSNGSVIDLRAATGEAGAGGGGFVSHANGIRGGFTIAVGVTIENAKGGSGADRLIGNEVDNVLTGGGGKDRMTGNGGDDTFVFRKITDSSAAATSSDVITDFEDSGDVLDFNLIDASVMQTGIQDFAFIGKAAAFTAPGQVRYAVVGSSTYVYLNTDNDQAAESVIILSGAHQLTADNFLF